MIAFLLEALRDGGIDTSVVVIGSTDSLGSIRGGRGAEIEFLKKNPAIIIQKNITTSWARIFSHIYSFYLCPSLVNPGI